VWVCALGTLTGISKQGVQTWILRGKAGREVM
jgi:hypothetical protein